eukprot:COSAG06_NODE_262_length_18897_cov_122.542877_14_plen_326_part_00
MSAAAEAEQQLALPRIGFGTSASRDVQAQVGASLAAGFRLVDTAKQYGNEPGIGAALQAAFAAGSVSREEVFLLTKISEKDLGYDATAAGVQEALTKLTVPCIDAVLIHWPGDRADMSNPANSERRLGSWRALEELRAQGKVRNIGVSNFTIAHCQEIMAVSSTPIYANEIEVHPWLQNSELVDFCQEHNIKVGCAALILLAASCWVFACTCPTAECSHCCSAVVMLTARWLHIRRSGGHRALTLCQTLCSSRSRQNSVQHQGSSSCDGWCSVGSTRSRRPRAVSTSRRTLPRRARRWTQPSGWTLTRCCRLESWTAATGYSPTR